MSGIATSSDVDEFKPSVAESLDGELHQGSGMTATLVLRVYGDHLDDTQRFVVVLLENDEAHWDIVARGHHEGFGAVGEAVSSDVGGLGCAPWWAVEQIEYRSSENVLERDEDWLPREEGQLDHRLQIGRCQWANPVRLRGSAGLLGHADAPFHDGFHDGEADTRHVSTKDDGSGGAMGRRLPAQERRVRPPTAQQMKAMTPTLSLYAQDSGTPCRPSGP